MAISGTAKRMSGRAEHPAELSYGELGSGADGAAERGHLAAVLRRLIDAALRRADGALLGKELFQFLRSNAERLALDLPLQVTEIESLEDLPLLERRALLEEMAAALPEVGDGPAGALDCKIAFLTRTLDLEEHEGAILGLLARHSLYGIWQNLVERFGNRASLGPVPAAALMLGISEEAAYRGYSGRGNLTLRGLAEEERVCGGIDVRLHDFVIEFLRSSAKTEPEMLAKLLPVAPASALKVDDFAHMRTELGRACKLVASALASGTRANILLHGPPGTGKTEFARLLAESCGTTAISVGEVDGISGEPRRHERINHLQMCRRLLGTMRSSVLLIDEADDMFTFGPEHRGSKLWLNMLVEDGTGPHVWIVNEPWVLGEPIVRRMDMAIGFELPHTAARRDIAQRMVVREGTGLALAAGEAGSLASELAELGATPAILSAALRSGGMVGETAEGVVTLARDLALASGRFAHSARDAQSAAFDPALSLADCDLVDLAERLTSSPRSWSLLLAGPPGTGKSAFARHLAERAGLDIIVVSGSDLLRPYVGQTEQKIANLFARAERRGALLLIDEADSFLFSRDTATRSWEVSMTNEMLCQMERGRVRFVATTNRAPALDHAAARRFTLRVDFATLDPARTIALFEASFAQPAPVELVRVGGLTPGDFAQVRHRAAVLGVADAVQLVRWLAQAAEQREVPGGRIGF